MNGEIILTLLGAQLKVTPEELHRQSGVVSKNVSSIKEDFREIEFKVRSTASYWKGEAADSFRAMYSSYLDEIAEIIARLIEHIIDLNEMAGVYEEAESDVQEIIEALPTDVII